MSAETSRVRGVKQSVVGRRQGQKELRVISILLLTDMVRLSDGGNR